MVNNRLYASSLAARLLPPTCVGGWHYTQSVASTFTARRADTPQKELMSCWLPATKWSKLLPSLRSAAPACFRAKSCSSCMFQGSDSDGTGSPVWKSNRQKVRTRPSAGPLCVPSDKQVHLWLCGSVLQLDTFQVSSVMFCWLEPWHARQHEERKLAGHFVSQSSIFQRAPLGRPNSVDKGV